MGFGMRWIDTQHDAHADGYAAHGKLKVLSACSKGIFYCLDLIVTRNSRLDVYPPSVCCLPDV